MSRYNHFTDHKYRQIPISQVAIGDKFRMDRRKGKSNAKRYDIVMIRTSERKCIEARSKAEYIIMGLDTMVSHYSELNTTS